MKGMAVCWNRFGTGQILPVVRPGHGEEDGQAGAQVDGSGIGVHGGDQSSQKVLSRDV